MKDKAFPITYTPSVVLKLNRRNLPNDKFDSDKRVEHSNDKWFRMKFPFDCRPSIIFPFPDKCTFNWLFYCVIVARSPVADCSIIFGSAKTIHIKTTADAAPQEGQKLSLPSQPAPAPLPSCPPIPPVREQQPCTRPPPADTETSSRKA